MLVMISKTLIKVPLLTFKNTPSINASKKTISALHNALAKKNLTLLKLLPGNIIASNEYPDKKTITILRTVSISVLFNTEILNNSRLKVVKTATIPMSILDVFSSFMFYLWILL